MADEYSAVEAWLDCNSTAREILIVQKRFPDISFYQAAMFALAIEILANLETQPTLWSVEGEEDSDPEDDEPWR